MANSDLKAFMRALGVRQWQVAKRLGIGESTFTRALRYPLSAEMERQVRAAVEEIKAEGI